MSVDNIEQPLDLELPCFQTNKLRFAVATMPKYPLTQLCAFRRSQPASAPNGSAGAAWVLQQVKKQTSQAWCPYWNMWELWKMNTEYIQIPSWYLQVAVEHHNLSIRKVVESFVINQHQSSKNELFSMTMLNNQRERLGSLSMAAPVRDKSFSLTW